MTFQMNSASLSRRLKRLYYHLNFIHLLLPMKFPLLLRENAPVLSQPLCSIFNASVRERFVLSIWKSANITPIQKSLPPKDVDSNFKPISLTPIISKILESFPYKRLFNSISKKIDPLQFGSLKGSSTSMALVYMLHK